MSSTGNFQPPMQANCEDICTYFRLDVNHSFNPDPVFCKVYPTEKWPQQSKLQDNH